MKKFGIISAAFLLMGMLFGSQAMAQGQIDFRTNSAQQCANVSQDGFTATFSFSGIQAEKGTFSEIKMDGTYPSGNVGEPSLPAANQLIAVPFGAKNVTIEVKNFSTTTYRLADYGIKTVMPQQASVSKSQKPEDVKFAYSEKAYAAKSMSQRPIATLEMKGTMRGIQVGSLTINPVNYNPATNTIEVYNDIEIEVRYNDYDKSAAYNEFARTFSPYFSSIYKTMFNWRDDVYDQHPDLWQAPVRMLVIADRTGRIVFQAENICREAIKEGYCVSIIRPKSLPSVLSSKTNTVKRLPPSSSSSATRTKCPPVPLEARPTASPTCNT